LGESPFRAVEREIREELSLEVVAVETFHISETVIRNMVIRLEVIRCVTSGLFDGVSSDHDEFSWLSPDELYSVEWAKPDLPAVAALAHLGNFSL
jgi:8-oxo-dGTP diphosphatase